MEKKVWSTKSVRLCIVISLIITGVFFVASICIGNLPETEAYVYENGKIIVHSSHDFFENIASAVLCLLITIALLATVICVISKVKHGQKIAKKIIFVWLTGIICSFLIAIGNVLVIGIYDESDYNPSCYEFTDEKHRIVIEEKSFLLYGGGSVYQISDDNSAFEIGSFSTDDGYRNNGDYDIKWDIDCVEITYIWDGHGKHTDKMYFVQKEN